MQVSKQELQELSFGDLIEVKQAVGTRAFNSIYNEKEGKEQKEKPKKIKRQDKNMPIEITSKKPVSRKRTIVEVPAAPKYRDPRFEPLAGKLNEGLFKRSYGFIREYQESELELLKNDIQKEKDSERKEELKKTLSRLTSKINAQKAKDKQEQAKREYKKKEQALVKEGKTPFFLKKSELKKRELIEKYKSIGKGANLEKVLEKRRKKNAAKEHTRIPTTRRSG
ncbi:rRNA biogenesis protein rrp36 [Boothiomyces macroporosus]|uniref:rRNA biogenesis protein RRP36 n=1 Tax=Boothiomyces macroporosus TaxID=261099 RepID=A0AAD5UP90_9FUNG|nr:rRNA biogenesis protein rrp36 [Boothiomyces macroporosus]